MRKSDLQLIGVILYKCEGTRLRKDLRYPSTYYYAIEFTNSDPKLIQLFLEFLRKIVGIEENKLKCELFLYSDQNIKELEQFWSKISSVNRFNKTLVFQSKNSKYKPSPFGTCKLRYHDKGAYLRLNEVIKSRLGEEYKLI